MRKAEQELLTRLEEAIKRGYALVYGKEDSLKVIWQIYCKEHSLPLITIHESRKGRARVRCIFCFLSDDTRVLIERIGQEVGLVDGEKVSHRFDKTAYMLDGSELYTYSSIPTSSAVFFVEGIVNLLRSHPGAITLASSV